MSSDPLHDLVDTARRLGLLSDAQAEQATKEFRADKPSTFSEGASRLLAKKTLTAYQVELLQAGKGEECVLAGRYHLLEKLGEGGMGEVFKARDAKLDRSVAIKIMAPHLVENPDAVARFGREARALAHLSHPGIVQAHDTGEDAGRHFLVMELVEGESLTRKLNEQRTISPTRAADYIHQAALALHKAHAAGLVHRDLKPANLLVTPDGKVKILDLGLARFVQDQIGEGTVTREGMGLGTPDYMAPEQFRDARRVDPRADLYSLGCTLFHLLTGRVPFPGSSLSEKAKAHEEQDPPAVEILCPEAPAGLVFVVRRMMAKQPDQRFQTAQEIAEALAPYIAGSSASLPELNLTKSWQGSQLSFTLRARQRRLLRRPLALAAGFVGIAAGVALAWPWIFPKQETSGGRSPPEKLVERKPPTVQTIANGLTVAKDGTGQFATINEAIDKAKAGMTIRVLDDGVYKETFNLNRATTQTGLTLEAAKGATLLFPAAKVGLNIVNVPRVTVRGFRCTNEGDLMYMIGVGGKSHGLRLQNLDIKNTSRNTGTITIECIEPDGEVAIIENCRLQGGAAALRVSGFLTYTTPTTCGNVVVRNNTVLDAQQGILAMGSLKNVHIVGNRVAFASLSGIQLENLLPGTEGILLANNTVLECGFGMRLWEDAGKKDLGRNVKIINNLIVRSQNVDVAFLDSGGDPNKVRGAGDGNMLLKHWEWSNNWRVFHEPKGDNLFSKAWVPVASADTRQDQIDELPLEPTAADFLRPAKSSPLSKAGKGGDFPAYVGALSPDHSIAWDWNGTWEAVVHNRVTVSQDPKAGGRFRTIKEALDAVRPGRAVHVLDDATYSETLLIRSANHQGITLESPRRATLTFPESSHMGLTILNVPNCTVRGFRLVTKKTSSFSIGVGGVCPDVTFEKLEFRSLGTGTVGISLEGADSGDSARPIVIRQCTFTGCGNAIQLLGKVLASKQPSMCRGVAIYDNRISDASNGIYAVGQLKNLLIAGNCLWNCAETGVRLEDVYANSSALLIANNSLKTRRGLSVLEPLAAIESMAIRNNLSVAEGGADFFYSGKNPDAFASWHIENNWRQAKPPPKGSADSQEWIVSEKDKFVDRLDLVSVDPDHADFLRPSSKFADVPAGHGLPAYVGALPPPGVPPWQWTTTWQARFAAAGQSDKK